MQVWTVLWDFGEPEVDVFATKNLAKQGVIAEVKKWFEDEMGRPFDDNDPEGCIKAYAEKQEGSIDIRPAELQGYDVPVPPKITATYPEPATKPIIWEMNDIVAANLEGWLLVHLAGGWTIGTSIASISPRAFATDEAAAKHVIKAGTPVTIKALEFLKSQNPAEWEHLVKRYGELQTFAGNGQIEGGAA